MTTLKEKTAAPEFSLPDQNGNVHKLSSYRGRYVLLYFYPKDDTAGCTAEACSIRDVYKDFESNNVKVLGVSSDPEESHKKFEQKYSLPFTLLSDSKKEVIKMYGAEGPLGTKRISYLIDPNGTIAKVYPKVTPDNHGTDILRDIYKIKN